MYGYKRKQKQFLGNDYILKYFFIWKYIKIIFFLFKKIIFDINI
jgi:hypothetical protein